LILLEPLYNVDNHHKVFFNFIL